MSFNCQFCQNPIKGQGWKFCSEECGQKYHVLKKREAKELEKCTPRPCENCKNVFTPVYGLSMRTKFCSKECCEQFRTANFLCKKRDETKANPPVIRSCFFCKNDFQPKRHSNNQQQFCSLKCKTDNHAAEQRKKREERRAATIRNCPICNDSFSPTKSLKEIYCSKKCRMAIGKRIYKMMQSCYEVTNTIKADHAHEVLGYSPNQLLEHLKTFPDWETLKTKSWHLDHIFPIIAFVREDIKDISLICCLENLRPLDGVENNLKNDTYDEKSFEQWLSKKLTQKVSS